LAIRVSPESAEVGTVESETALGFRGETAGEFVEELIAPLEVVAFCVVVGRVTRAVEEDV
jgi:hypothetical protein